MIDRTRRMSISYGRIPVIEAKIQADIVQYLIPLRRSGALDFFSVPNEAAANPVRQGQLIAMGLRPGVSDLVLMFPEGKVIFMEVKNETGIQSPAQKAFEQECKNLGFKYVLVRSVEDVRMVLENGCYVVRQNA